MNSSISRRAFATGALSVAALATLRGNAKAMPRVIDPPLQPARRMPRIGSLGAADALGWELPAGYRSRLVIATGDPLPGSATTFPGAPDGAGVFPRGNGGWTICWNNELGNGAGGVTGLTFDAAGSLTSATQLATGMNRPCAGGTTPWATWLSCEEVPRGRVFEIDPRGRLETRVHPQMGVFNHEAAVVDSARRCVYLSEDRADGLFYRYRYAVDNDLSVGVLEAAVVAADSTVTWVAIPDPLATTTECRAQVPATAFNGGEGLVLTDGRTVLLTTKNDGRLWSYDIVEATMVVVYDPATAANPVLRGPDNVTVTPAGDAIVCEDGDNMELVAVDRQGRVAPFARLAGQPGSELTGVNLSPDGRRLYVGSQRAFGPDRGAIYEITGPFPW
jgi:secreted PhoX family phosphatase